jgi:hypothetical protein
MAAVICAVPRRFLRFSIRSPTTLFPGTDQIIM